MDIKQAIIDSTPILQVITHYSADTRNTPAIRSPHGEAVPKEWRYSLDVNYSSTLYAEEAETLTAQAHLQMIKNISDELPLTLCDERVFNSDILHIDAKYKRGWVLLCSPETFYKMRKQTRYEFRPDVFGGGFYLYDGVKTYRHNTMCDIFINTEQSAVFNFDAIGKTEVVNETLTTITAKETIFIRGYWLIVSPTAKKI